MSRSRAAYAALLLVFALSWVSSASGQAADAPNRQALEHWNDFMHYGLIARPDLAAASGEELLAMEIAEVQLLRVVEASRYADRYLEHLAQFEKMGGELGAAAKQVGSAIESARLSVARDPERIRESIEKLDDSLRARLNAIRRLKVAGEYAAPEMLRVLAGQSDEDQALRPYVLEAMVQLGRPMVLPMAEGMSALPGKAKAQVARSLGRIGYPAALPFLKQVIEEEQTDETTRQAAVAALQRIASRRGLDTEASAASMFFQLAEDYYEGQPSLILAPEASSNMVWYVDEQAGEADIDPAPVPTAVFADIMAMRMARRALTLDPTMDRSLQLWLAANFRRENRMPEGARVAERLVPDRSTAFYGRMAGPTHLKSVLARAIRARDTDLALDAITALRRTGGQASLIGDAGVLLAAMNYPDARVRLEAALAVARSNPAEAFPGSERVVPLLAEAANQTATPQALVIAPQREALNTLSAKLREVGAYEAHQAASLDDVASVLSGIPAADLVIVRGEPALLRAFRDRRGNWSKLQASPVVVLAGQAELATANAIFHDDASVVVAGNGAVETARLKEAVSQAVMAVRGEPMTEAEALRNAERALAAMRDLALLDSAVFDVTEAQGALIEALASPEPSVVTGAAGVLAWFESVRAQEAIGEAALKADQPASQRAALLEALADSFKRHGQQLPPRLSESLQNLVRTSSGEVADAAAQAFGAGDMPTREIVELITK